MWDTTCERIIASISCSLSNCLSNTFLDIVSEDRMQRRDVVYAVEKKAISKQISY